MSISKEAIEAAAAEICDWDNQYAWKSLGAESPMKASYEDAAERALTAAAPAIQAAALRDAAEVVQEECYVRSGDCFCGSAAWLTARADQIEGNAK